jgi:protein-S-isoprenylcysteine O-methyltransferase Ste14
VAEFFNLWVFYLVGYIIAYSIQVWANRKRSQPFDDPDLISQKRIYVPALVWIFSGFAISLFVPVDFGFLFYVGFSTSIIGMAIGAMALYSFAHSPGLTTTRIHRYSRNPIYVGWTIFFLGLTIIGWSNSIWSFVFVGYFIFTLFYLHWTVLIEEGFLAEKYGDGYQRYLEHTSRYWGRPKKSPHNDSSAP